MKTLFNDFFSGDAPETETVDISIDNYQPLPPKVRPDKLKLLLKKQQNKHQTIQNIYDEVVMFLNDNAIVPVDLTISGEPFSILDIDKKVALFIIEDYSRFNTGVFPRNIQKNIILNGLKKDIVLFGLRNLNGRLRKRNVLQSLILHACGKTKNRIYARKTYATIIPSKDLREFFNKSSFYGYRNGSFAVCLRDKETDEILMAMNFGHPFYGKNKYGENAVECIRAASKPHTVIVGGMSKLMKFMLEKFGNEFDTIIYYIDDSHYSSKSMASIGFNFSHFAGGASHNLWVKTGAMLMRTPMLHQEITFLIRKKELVAVPDVGNSTFLYKSGTDVGTASSTDT